MITELIASGQAKITDAQRKRDEKEQARNEAIQAEILKQAAELDEILNALFPAEVLEFTGLCTELPTHEDAFYRIEAPECTPVSFRIHREWVGGGEGLGTAASHRATDRPSG